MPSPITETNKKSDTSDGEGTINEAYDEYVTKTRNLTIADVHHRVNSQEIADAIATPVIEIQSEETITASENENEYEIEMDDEQKEVIIRKRIRAPQSSSDEELKEKNSIVSNIGSFIVNSFIPFGDKGNKKAKKEPPPGLS